MPLLPVRRVLLQAFMGLQQALSPVVDLVFPARCPLCGTGVAPISGSLGMWGCVVSAGAGWSFRQRQLAACASGHSSAKCQKGWIARHALRETPLHDGIAAATVYNSASRRLVLSFKYGGRIGLAPMLARLMLTRLSLSGIGGTDAPLDQSWFVVPVPLHRWRLWRRGFNQSALLAREIAQVSGRGWRSMRWCAQAYADAGRVGSRRAQTCAGGGNSAASCAANGRGLARKSYWSMTF